MDLVVSDSASVRALSRIVHTAARLSDYLQFSPAASALQLRVLSASQTAFAAFRLREPFFSEHNFPLSAQPHKVPTRALLPPLRSPASLASLRIRSTSDSLHFVLHARSGVCKQFRIPLVDGRVSSVSALNPRYALRSSPRLLLDILLNFHLKLDEITLVPTAEALKFTSYLDDDPSHVILRTEMTVSSSELEEYNFPSDPPTLTIPCRPLRAALDFCEPFDSPVTLHFSKPGEPLLLTLENRNINDLVFDARFIFASRQPETSNPSRSRRATTQLPADTHSTQHTLQQPSPHPHPPVTPVQQSIMTHALRTPPSHARRTPTHTSPPSAYVSPSQAPPERHSFMEFQHASDDDHASQPSDPFANSRALSDSQAPQEDQDDEYVDATPPP